MKPNVSRLALSAGFSSLATLQLILWIVLYQAIGYLMGFLTQANVSSWYGGLERSPYSPPSITFAIAWGLLYVALAVLAFWLVNVNNSKDRCMLLSLYGLQMLLNWSWTPVFFSFHAIAAALIILLLMVVINFYLTWRLFFINQWLAILNGIYLLWLCFATYLNAYIWWAN